ncbi:hypothetical protein UPYG_G00203590 [Umbra pygmaea]|uniref:Uncharacterized protein n=1 Tax=Umbra pygmaea TaxID=75934 RepID=A0ABD0WIR6_UMBPY
MESCGDTVGGPLAVGYFRVDPGPQDCRQKTENSDDQTIGPELSDPRTRTSQILRARPRQSDLSSQKGVRNSNHFCLVNTLHSLLQTEWTALCRNCF